MKKIVSSALYLAFAFISLFAYAQTDVDHGQVLSQACVACHGQDGNSSVTTYPKIAGQNQRYFIEQMLDFKQGEQSGRANPIMAAIVANLSSQDITDLAFFYSQGKMTIGIADANLVKTGEQIYRGGVLEKGIPACSACHGPQGEGNSQAGFPRLGGQHADYIVAQLQAYKNNQRRNDINNIMRIIAKKMSDEDVQAVASYIQGLH